jgi:hypothetical protein
MITLTLRRLPADDQGTIGGLYHNGKRLCYVTELPWRDNRNNLSRIPAGRYQAHYMPRSGSGKYRDVYHLQNVPKRGGVLIHSGNYSGDTTLDYRSDTHGCLLPGKRLGMLQGQRAVVASRAALQAIHTITQRHNFELEIIDHA